MLKRLSSEVIKRKVSNQMYDAEKIIKFNNQFNVKFIKYLNENKTIKIRIFPLDILSERAINKLIAKSTSTNHANLFCTSDVFNVTLTNLKGRNIYYNLEKIDEGYYIFSLI